jgi:hypothetical protein
MGEFRFYLSFYKKSTTAIDAFDCRRDDCHRLLSKAIGNQ